MELLTEQALQKARTNISQSFADPDSMDDLGVLSFQLERQLQAAESQLNSAVQSKLDSLKRAVDLMDESALKLNKLSSNISRIDEKIAQTNTSISNYNYLKRVHNARENLSKVISQVEFFAKVPERVTYLKQRLEENPAFLKEVFLEALKLDSLRIALMKEIKVSRNRRLSAPVEYNTGGGGISSPRNDGTYSETTFMKIKEAIENHLHYVPELVDMVNSKVQSNIERMFDLAADAPADLVASFEIIEMQQEYNDRRNQALDHSKGRTDEFGNVSADMQTRIRRLLDEKVQSEFDAISDSSAGDTSISPLTALIMGANQVLQKITVFKEDVVPCMPPHYEPMFMFMEAFELILIPKVDQFVADMTRLKVSEILDFINWIEYHAECMVRFDFPEQESLSHFSNVKVELMTEYKDRIKNQVVLWFENIKKQQLEISKATDGTLVTSNPEDMFNIIHAQLEVAREKLPPDYTQEVAIACLQVLQGVQRDTHDSLSRNWRDMDAEYMCALVNDSSRMKDKCEEFGQHLVQFVAEGTGEKELLCAMLDEVSREYTAISIKAVSSLARCIIEELDEPIFSKLYSIEWEEGENISSVLTVTLADYAADLSDWLAGDFFSALLRELVCLIIQRYVMYLRKRFNGVFTFGNELRATTRVLTDRNTIQEFFEAQLEQATGAAAADTKAGAGAAAGANAAKIGEEFLLMVSFARVISARHPSGAEADVRALYRKWGVDGLKIVLAANQVNPSIGKPEKQANAEVARELFDAGVASQLYSTKPIEEYEDFDVGQATVPGGGSGASMAAKVKETVKQNRGFWGGRSKQ